MVPWFVVHIDRIVGQVDKKGEKAVLNVKLFQRLLEDGTGPVLLHQFSARNKSQATL